jgi:hypothetical protein
MKQANIDTRQGLAEIVEDTPTIVSIPNTNKSVKIRGVKPYTLERITKLWLERDLAAAPTDSASTLKSMCSEPYFAVREALYFVLNSWWKINLFHRFLTFWWGKVKGYTDEQMLPIIQEGKKKLPLTAHWMIMAYSADMRTDMVKMTKTEAEQYRAELLSVASQLSSKNSHATEGQGGSSSDS